MSLEFINVDYEYDSDSNMSVKALKNINLTIEAGVFYGLIGHTGSGKSTLVQHMNGLLQPTGGEVRLDGVSLADKSVDMRSVRSRVGLVFQYPEHQLFETTVYNDVCFGPKNMKLNKAEIDERASRALMQAGIGEELWDASPFELSGGQKRRVAIAGVLAMRPEILILDEPTAGLDPRGRDMILEQIKTLHEKEGMTVVLVSHSMEDVAMYADRLIVMNKGEVRYNDTPAAVFSGANIEELEDMGLMAPQVTYILKALKSKGLPVREDIITIEAAADEIAGILKR